MKSRNGIVVVIASLLLLTRALPLRAELDDLEAEERVKKLLVSTLDPALPKEALAAWVTRQAGPKGKVSWEVNDCGEQSGEAGNDGRDLPACVQASIFLRDGREFGVLITVGTWEKGFVGAPRVRQVYWAEGQQTHTLKRLSQIPAEISNGPADTEDAEVAPAGPPTAQ